MRDSLARLGNVGATSLAQLVRMVMDLNAKTSVR